MHCDPIETRPIWAPITTWLPKMLLWGQQDDSGQQSFGQQDDSKMAWGQQDDSGQQSFGQQDDSKWAPIGTFGSIEGSLKVVVILRSKMFIQVHLIEGSHSIQRSL